jgi:hypothetical protein
MPRKLRTPKARRGRAADVSPGLYALLLWNDFRGALAIQDRCGGEAWELFEWITHESVWGLIVDDALLEWTAVYPGTRPTAWWWWTAPELRQLIGGTYTRILGLHRCHETGIPHIDHRYTEAPLVESEPAYLDRLQLWLPGERARVPAAAFAAQPFSFTLTVRREAMPDPDADDESDDRDESNGAA